MIEKIEYLEKKVNQLDYHLMNNIQRKPNNPLYHKLNRGDKVGAVKMAEKFIKAYCKKLDFTFIYITGRGQNKELNWARYPLYWFLYFEIGLPLHIIGGLFANRNHATIKYGLDIYHADRDVFLEYSKYTEILKQLISEKDIYNEVLLP
jgi:chromosomal replication initiation ATPase DnaA